MIKLAWMAISLTQGLYALVDKEDFERLSQQKWYIKRCRKNLYAERHSSFVNGKRCHIYMHREIMQPPPNMEIDHINGNGLDNRKCNLRICTSRDNKHNQRPVGGSSNFKGVYWRKQQKQWSAQITCNNKRIYLGLFRNEIDAAKRYDKEAIKLFGEFARLNLLKEN